MTRFLPRDHVPSVLVPLCISDHRLCIAMKLSKACTAKTCGILVAAKAEVNKVVAGWEKDLTTFVGLDVSSKYGGIVCLQFQNSRLVSVHSRVIDLKRKAADTKDGVLERRFTIIRKSLNELSAAFPSVKTWNLAVEDKIIRAGGAKGVIGSHTLAETLVAARLAAHLEFPNSKIQTINPRSARAGLGLNLTGDEAGRDETKRRVISFVKRCFPLLSWSGDATDEDRADACIIALSAVRSALNVSLLQSSNVRAHFRACHKEDFATSDLDQSNFNRRKTENIVTEVITERVNSWVDEVWLKAQQFV